VDDRSVPPDGILLVDKPSGKSSFLIVSIVRRRTRQPKVGHSGTLDPFATGLLVLLLGRQWTRLAGTFLNDDKEYEASIFLGAATDTYDRTGVVTARSSIVPSLSDIERVVSEFQGECLQTPPMFSAKKVDGKRLYDLARKGICVERQPKIVRLVTTVCSYQYPYLSIHVACSKGTYIRSLAHDIGEKLGCLAHVIELRRTRSGPFSVDEAITLSELDEMDSACIGEHCHTTEPSSDVKTSVISQALCHSLE
jgi:tRNA pseudouridine55 synthase